MDNDFSVSQSEAFLNEYKGNILEFILAQICAKYLNCEVDFISSVPEEYLKELSLYEKRVRELNRSLYDSLAVIGQIAFEQIIKEIELSGSGRVELVGKKDGVGKNNRWHEGDFVIFDHKNVVPISLKLYKKKSFVNTKSGGVKSFITKYFSAFITSEKDQIELSQVAELEFTQMGQKLFDIAGLGEFQGFGDEWFNQNYSDRPGELSKEMREILFRYYNKIASALHHFLKKYLEQNSILFFQALLPLFGFSSRDIVQVICTHRDNYKKIEANIYRCEDIEKRLDSFILEPLRKEISSFEISSDNAILQIRIKPMNKFTVPGLKINCSINYK